MAKRKAAATTGWRNRIIGHGEEAPDQLLAHPLNWRVHPALQQEALLEALEDVGWVGDVLVNQRTGHVVDGHLRVALALRHNRPSVPVRYVDLTEEEELRVLATLDPLAQLAVADPQKLDEVLRGISEARESTLRLLEDLANRAGLLEADTPKGHQSGALVAKFVVPPFTVLDARQGYWKARKEEWLAMGLHGEAGRDARALPLEKGGNMCARLAFGTSYRVPEGSGYEYPTDALTTAGGTSVFDPVLAELAYRWFGIPGGTVLDPFAGESVKGIVAEVLGYRYTGVELRPEQIAANRQQAGAVGVAPTWVCGDSAELDKLLPEGELYDLVFTSPPYFDLEVYSEDDLDGSAFSDYGRFMDWYTDIFRQAVARLAQDRFLVVKVGDVRDDTGAYRCFVADTIRALVRLGLCLYNDAVLVTPLGSLPVRAGRYFTHGRKLGKGHQNVLVFFKGDPRVIRELYTEEVEHGAAAAED